MSFTAAFSKTCPPPLPTTRRKSAAPPLRASNTMERQVASLRQVAGRLGKTKLNQVLCFARFVENGKGATGTPPKSDSLRPPSILTTGFELVAPTPTARNPSRSPRSWAGTIAVGCIVLMVSAGILWRANSAGREVNEPPALAEQVRETAPSPAPEQVYTVKAGDSLGVIAQQTLGTTQGWRAILAANPQLQDPDRLEVGMTLIIPQ